MAGDCEVTPHEAV